MLEHLDALVGQWETAATHQLLPGTDVRGHATFEWLEGGHFLIWRGRNEHPDFPDNISILGCEDPDAADDSGDSGGAVPTAVVLLETDSQPISSGDRSHSPASVRQSSDAATPANLTEEEHQ